MSENRASLAALMQHEWLWEARRWLTRDAFNSLRLYSAISLSRRVAALIGDSAQGRGRALIKRPSSNCIFSPGVIAVLHYTVAHSPSRTALLTSMAGGGLC